MEYALTKTVSLSYEEAEIKITEELKKEGFGILTKIEVVEHPYCAPYHMPVNMIIPAVGPTFNVNGRVNAIVAAGPNPGKTPITVPIKAPKKQTIRLVKLNAETKPFINCSIKFILILPQKNSSRQIRI